MQGPSQAAKAGDGKDCLLSQPACGGLSHSSRQLSQPHMPARVGGRAPLATPTRRREGGFSTLFLKSTASSPVAITPGNPWKSHLPRAPHVAWCSLRSTGIWGHPFPGQADQVSASGRQLCARVAGAHFLKVCVVTFVRGPPRPTGR